MSATSIQTTNYKTAADTLQVSKCRIVIPESEIPQSIPDLSHVITTEVWKEAYEDFAVFHEQVFAASVAKIYLWILIKPFNASICSPLRVTTTRQISVLTRRELLIDWSLSSASDTLYVGRLLLALEPHFLDISGFVERKPRPSQTADDRVLMDGRQEE
ncbi:hypothetical protein PROFUN_10269 [Planoprotostelium fungivorum]|uniref:Uncharacterized protein n=1 Tax=Planoprotostelium fungivorum TaxID=1890364 RepID=A0A2P6NEK9_9EUKA|nr:hypothetical protein PROFUN_10269 [Planoprotostelium fungivorum]